MYLVSVDPMDRSYISNFQAYITGYDYFHDNEEAKIRSYIRDLNLSEIPKYVPDCFNVLVVQGNCFNFDKKILTAQEKFALKCTKIKICVLCDFYSSNKRKAQFEHLNIVCQTLNSL